VLPVRARSLMRTILSAPLHPHFGSYPPGWVTHTQNWHEYMCHSLFRPFACAHGTAAPAHESMRKYYGCIRLSSCAGMPEWLACCFCYCVLQVRQRVVPVGRRRSELRQQSCATRDAMPKLHFAASAAPYAHSLAWSSSFCICSRLCVLLTKLVRTGEFTTADMAKLAHIGTVWGNPSRRRSLPHTRH